MVKVGGVTTAGSDMSDSYGLDYVFDDYFDKCSRPRAYSQCHVELLAWQKFFRESLHGKSAEMGGSRDLRCHALMGTP